MTRPASKPSLRKNLAAFIRPWLGTLTASWLAASGFALLDSATLVLIIPFVETVFAASGPAGAGAEPRGVGEPVSDLLDATVYRWIDLQGDPLDAVTGVIALIFVLFALKNGFGFLRDLLAARLEEGIDRDVSRRLYETLIHTDLSFFGRARAGELVTRLTSECERLKLFLGRELTRLASALCLVVACVAAMALISWRLTLAAAVVVPSVMLLWGPMVSRLRGREHVTAGLRADVAARVLETVSMIRVVKGASAERRESERFDALTERLRESRIRAAGWKALVGPATEMLATAGTVAILWLGARLVVDGSLAGAGFVAFLALSMRLFSPVKAVANVPALAMPGFVAAERVCEFLALPREGSAGNEAARGPAPVFEREIRFEKVGFTYPEGGGGLRDLSFSVAKGRVLGIVGPSGAGKSTLADLLAGFMVPDAGRITVDGVDTRRIPPGELRALMALVPQGGVLFSDTVRANIAYGRPTATRQEIEAAARSASAHAFIAELPQGYDAQVGEGGASLSAGERQRIAIARALLADRPILILDEATSDLDPNAEREVVRAVKTLCRERTVILIAHRIATARIADETIVLEGGRMVESGDHEELIRTGGLYSTLFAPESPAPGRESPVLS